jgi:hypothetical protein
LALANADPKRCLIIDAALPPEAIAEFVWRAVEQRLLGAG